MMSDLKEKVWHLYYNSYLRVYFICYYDEKREPVKSYVPWLYCVFSNNEQNLCVWILCCFLTQRTLILKLSSFVQKLYQMKINKLKMSSHNVWGPPPWVSYVFHRKYKHKQDCGICREGRGSIASVFHWHKCLAIESSPKMSSKFA